MARTIVIELLLTGGCAVLGAQLWTAESSRPLLGPSSRGRDREHSVEQSAALADVGAGTRGGFDAGDGDAVAGETAAPSARLATADDAIADADSPSKPSAASRTSRAESSAIAPLPPLDGPLPPRLPEELAFAALRLVGKDPAAFAIWNEAINDLGHNAETRSDLIEDLNDEGYPDPDHLTIADLPLISARLAIIERLAPHAADEVNAAAFEEAYKDLLGMWLELKRGESK